uniref:Uncharacterized protein n=1 Tax=Marseillevirus sp. TaxID=2809551 RepID=A0AA96ENZ4_9VIRU|nr:hypothetical protein MarFTMF_025 [Marseillevirus sp.]
MFFLRLVHFEYIFYIFLLQKKYSCHIRIGKRNFEGSFYP